MPQPVVYVDTSEVKPGCIDALKAAMHELAVFVLDHEPQLLTYNVYFDHDESHMSVMHINADCESLRTHMRVAGPRFAPIGEYIGLVAIDVYGTVDADVTEALTQKARVLGDGTVRVHENYAGFARLGV